MRTYLAARGLVLLILAMIGSFLPAQAGFAAGSTSPYIQAPQLLAPVDTVLDTPNPPVFHWTGVPGAISYTLQVATDPQFMTIVASASTSNTRFTPTTEFANGTYYWRMKVQGANNQLSLYVSATFSVNWRTAPTLVAPKPGQTLIWGKDSFIFSWRALPFAATYNLEVSTSPNFGTTTFTGSTPNTALSIPGVTLQNGTIYYWRVQGVDAAKQAGAWTRPQSFVKQWSPVVPIYYPETLSAKTRAEVNDPVLRWARIDGAVKYEVQVSTDFLAQQGANSDQPAPASVVDDETVTLPYLVPKLGALPSANYSWHVRGIDSQGNPGPWSPWSTGTPGPWRFTVTVPPPVKPSMPADGSTITVPLLKWAAVPYAAYYELQTASNGDFLGPDAQTTLTYTNAAAPPLWIPPPFNQVTYWRVRAVTAAGIVGRWSTDITGYPWSFVFASGGPAIAISPLNNQHVTMPVLKWGRVLNAATYQVTIRDGVTKQFNMFSTPNTTFTPTDSILINDCASAACYWYVQAVTADGHTEPTPDPGTYGAFVDTALASLPVYAAAVPITPLPGAAATSEMPSFCWQAASGATQYQIYYSPGANTFQPLGSDQTAATCQTPTTGLADGTYKWFVRALDSAGNPVSDGPISQFTISSGMTNLGHTVSGCELLPSDYLTPQVVKASIYQPIFQWNPVPCAHGYHLYVSTNPFFASAITLPSDAASIPNTIDDAGGCPSTPPATPNTDTCNPNGYPYTVYLPCTVTGGLSPTSQTIVAPNASSGECPTNFANNSNNPPRRYYPQNGTLYLLVRPILAGGLEFPPHTKGIFNGERIAVTVPDMHLTSPANGGTVSDTPILHYHKYFQGTGYEVQIGTSPDLSTGIKVDATTFSGAFVPPSDLPDGTWYWRVRPVVSNIYYSPPLQLRWSAIWHFTKVSPAPTLSRPAANQLVTFTPVFTWQPIQRAAQYEIQVSYNDPSFLGTLLDTAKVNVPAYVPASLYPITARDGYIYWRVRMIDTGGNAGPWSAAARFQLRFNYPVALTPLAKETLGTRYPVFTYRPLPGAASYQIEISTIPDFSSVSQTIPTEGTSWTPITPLDPGTYYWRVKPVDALGGVGTPSFARSFTVPAYLAGGSPASASTAPATTPPATTPASVSITSALTTDPRGKPLAVFAAGVKEVNFQFTWKDARANVDAFQVLIYKSDGTEAGAGQIVKFPSPSGTEYRVTYYFDVQTKARVGFPPGGYRLTIDVDGKPMRDITFTVNK